MASAVSGYKRSFGSDGPPGCYDDFDHTDCFMAFGSNLPEQHPVIYWRLKEAREKRKFPVFVVDPRVTAFTQSADIHLTIAPGTDVVLLNSMAYVILNERLEDREYINERTTRGNDFEKNLDDFAPDKAARICGIDADTIRLVARTYAKAGAAMAIWTMGINQSTHGSDGVVAINNLNSPAMSAGPAAAVFRSPANATPWARVNGRHARGFRAIACSKTPSIAKKWRTSGASMPSSSPRAAD